MKLQIGILGTRGIPNNYGGYEQAVSFLSQGLEDKGHKVTVYNSHNHPYKGKYWNGVEIVRRYDPEYVTGTTGQFIYDLNCIRHARSRNYDVLLMMGYTSSSLWGRFYPKRTVIISNMDGLEWKRSKYSRPVQKYLRYAEKLAVKYSDNYIADSLAIQNYLEKTYKVSSRYIPYGAEIYTNENIDLLARYEVKPQEYYMLIARLEPENNIEIILDGFLATGGNKKFIVIGNTANKYGEKIQKKFGHAKNISFAGPLFDQQTLHSLKAFASIYFHGHSVGGTNPSLLEAMASRSHIAAHDNLFNREVLGEDAFYFSSAKEVSNIINTIGREEATEKMINNNLDKIKKKYNWPAVIDQYEDFIVQCFQEKHL